MRAKEADEQVQEEVLVHQGHLTADGAVIFPEPNLTEHKWRQHGIMIDCSSCQYAHGFQVGTDQLLTGIDDNGYPQFKSISD